LTPGKALHGPSSTMTVRILFGALVVLSFIGTVGKKQAGALNKSTVMMAMMFRQDRQ